MKKGLKILLIILGIIIVLILAFFIVPIVSHPKCYLGGGVWGTCPTTCGDYCSAIGSVCGALLTACCDCGPEKCWDGSKCVPNPKKNETIYQTKEDKKKLIWFVNETVDNRIEEHIIYAKEKKKGYIYDILPVNNTILKNQSAVFILTITNVYTISNGTAQDDYFIINTSKEGWNLTYKPSSGFVPANNKTGFIVRIKPNESVEEGQVYFIPVNIKAKRSEYSVLVENRFAVFITPRVIGG